MRRFSALLLCAVLAVVMSVPALAAVPQKIGALHEDFGTRMESAAASADLMSLTVRPGDEVKIPLPDDKETPLFFDQNGEGIPTGDVSLSRLRAARVGVEVKVLRGGEVIEEADFAEAGRKVYLQVRFVPQPPELEEIPFEMTLSVTMAGAAQPGAELRIGGVMAPRQVELTATSGEADLRGGVVAVAVQDVPAAVLIVGDGVTVTASLRAGERYYAQVAEEEGEPREATLLLTSYNLDDAGALLHIDRGVVLYVYDDEDVYLGTTRAGLALVPEYHLSPTRRI